MKRHMIVPTGGIILVLFLYTHLTNPFNRLSIIRNPYTITEKDGVLKLHETVDLQVMTHLPYRIFAFAKNGIRIVANVYSGSKKARGETADEVIREIHKLRFNPEYPYLISGDHFSVLYPRNLGVFYYPLLDNKTDKKEDRVKKQKIYLSTTAYTLEVFGKNGEPCTTIVPVGPKSVTCVNVYAYPSDALYGVLYALQVLNREPETHAAARELIKDHRTELISLLSNYKEKTFDKRTGLIRKDIHLSGTKDIAKRESAFYDNVIYWKTFRLAAELGIIKADKKELETFRARIIKTFWYEKGGYFLEDLSPASLRDHYYSSDWLAVFFTGFLDPQKPSERRYYERSVVYIRKEKLDEPFGLKYQQSDRASREYFVVRLFVPSYGGTAIWSFWGTEYTKLLISLYSQTGKSDYLKHAERQLKAYEHNIVTYKGFPELYSADGEMLRNFFYKSVRQTGWVVNYEQAEQMYQAAAR